MKKMFLLTTLILISIFLNAQQLFQKEFSMGYQSHLTDVTMDGTDSTFYFSGYVESIDSGAFVLKPLILKIDKFGNVIWNKIFNLTPSYQNGCIFLSILKNQNNGQFILRGGSTGNNFGQVITISSILIIDSSGSVISAKYFNVYNQEYYNDLIVTYDGGYALTGGKDVDLNSRTGKILILKLDDQLNQQWVKVYGDSSYNLGESIIQLPDSGFMISGRTFKYDNFDPDAFVIRTDINGNESWLKILKDTIGDSDRSQLANTNDSNIVLAYNSIQPFGDVVYFLKMDLNGNLFWQRAIGLSNNGSFTQFKQCSDDGFLFCSGRIWKLDMNGGHLWTQQNNGIIQTGVSRFCLTYDGGLMLAGNKFTTLASAYIQKSDSLAFSGCLGSTPSNFNYLVNPFNFINDVFADSIIVMNETVLSVVSIDSIPMETVFCSNSSISLNAYDDREVNLFPNPVFNFMTIECTNPDQITEMELFDIRGKFLLRKDFRSDEARKVNLEQLESGIYIVKILNGKTIITKKIIKN